MQWIQPKGLGMRSPWGLQCTDLQKTGPDQSTGWRTPGGKPLFEKVRSEYILGYIGEGGWSVWKHLGGNTMDK